MTKKHIVIGVIALVLVGGTAFLGGVKYGQTAKAFAKLSQTQRQKLLTSLRSAGGNGGGNAAGFGGGGANRAGQNRGGGFSNGEIISKDDKSITIKMPDNSSKIIFYSGTTVIGKAAPGTADDLAVGKQVTINGTANSDGSIVAQSIQIRPGTPMPNGQ